jgi:hypothetical protein
MNRRIFGGNVFNRAAREDAFERARAKLVPEPTHYIPAYAVRLGERERTVCGRYERPESHALEPTCPECRAAIEAEGGRS